MKLLELQEIYKTYHLGAIEVPVLKGVSLSVEPGEFVALMGTSGSGKTTLMNILGCLDRPTSGRYRLEGQEVTELTPDERALLRNRKLGFVFQTFNLLPRTSALENVMMPLSYNGVAPTDEEARQRARELLEQVGLGDRLDYEPSQLSGGQQQRVAIARALVNRPAVILADEPTGNLDSQTSAEVLELFRKLNEAGTTIILVTHDEQVARYAKRVIRIHDGVVDSESEEAAPKAAPVSEVPPETPAKRRSLLALPRLRWMARTAFHSLRRNLLRAALTALGIIIGVGAVIAMMEIGQGSSKAIQRTIASMGAANLLIFPGTAASGGVTFGSGTAMTLTPQDAEAIARECPAVRATAPIVRARTQVIYSNRNWVPIFIYGTTPEFLQVREWPLAEGEMFTDQHVRNASKVAVLGQRLVRELFQRESPLGKEIRVNNVAFKVIGVLSSKGANMMGVDQDDILLAPWTAIKFRVAGTSMASVNQSAQTSTSDSSQRVNTLRNFYPTERLRLYPEQSALQQANTPLPVRFTNVDQILAAAHSPRDIPAAMRQITQLLRERHRIRPGEPEDFNIRDMTEMTRALAATAGLMTKLLLSVALISLIVGGVGIMNIMLVSVTERTREIGLRLAVGAWSRDILQQFLVEAVFLCVMGGLVGILVGRGASYLITALLNWPTEMSVAAILAAFLVSVSVGIIFGYYPAWKASRLDPIVALRYE